LYKDWTNTILVYTSLIEKQAIN